MPRSPFTTTGRRSPGSDPDFNYAQAVFRELMSASLVLAEDWEHLDPSKQNIITACRGEVELYQALVEVGLLTSYQATRLRANKRFGLTLGNYRVVDRLGAGGMGVIYLAEHTLMRKRVAIKTLSLTPDQDERLVSRFTAEIRAIGRLRHPNIVAAIDAGRIPSTDPDAGALHYFVMEYLPGRDLEALIHAEGPLAPEKACPLAHQVADALLEAHRHRLIHRDIKPSNVLVTPEWSAKLLDFGLARTRSRLTEPGSVLGTLGYMAPEQARDATTVDERADIYSLGATLFWALTGQDPFPLTSNVAQDLQQRLNNPPPSIRSVRPELPAGLDSVVARMMAVAPADRYPNAQAVMRALLPFVEARPRAEETVPLRPAPAPAQPVTAKAAGTRAHHRVLVVDDEGGIRTFCSLALRADGIECEEAADGVKALEALAARPFDLVLLDIDMPQLNGTDTMKRIRQAPPAANLKVVMFSGRTAADDMAQMLLAGADDFLPKPFSIVQLRARVKAALRLKDAQDRSDLLNRHLLTVNSELEKSLSAKDVDLVGARNALVLALAKLIEARSDETGTHLFRLQRFCRVLGDEAMAGGDFGPAVDAAFVTTLEACAPLHDIGKNALPDHILKKPGKLDPEERLQMQTHTTVGADTLRDVARKFGFAAGFLQMGADIAQSHHERWDGAGYPDRLAGEDIPLAARFLAVADVYDALRSRRVYKPALPHHTAVMTIMETSPGHFDPKLLKVFQRCKDRFEQIFRDCGE
ncbi:MAG TPA: HD domain-containing phosphohydrolase [Gemmataceae bacterium]|jgi:response regulator RpfG family c-di-GMP phosphodiesterase/tRNA A-37 threonylcarbamoyl transferase component Bud32